MDVLLAGTVTEMIVGSPWTYAVILGSIAGSAVFPPLPSESMLVTAMSLAVAGELQLFAVLVATMTGALLGDVGAYGLGRSLGAPLRNRNARATRAETAIRWLETHEASWGPALIIAGRFVPGGTTAVGISAGLLSYPLRQFILFAALGAVLWTAYGLALAWMGTAFFPGNTWAGVITAIGLALGTAALVALVRRIGNDRRRHS